MSKDNIRSILNNALIHLDQMSDENFTKLTLEIINESSVRKFDKAIASLDRSLSEIMIQAKLPNQDDADLATLRHHAGDLILCGVAILKRLNKISDINEYIPEDTTKLQQIELLIENSSDYPRTTIKNILDIIKGK